MRRSKLKKALTRELWGIPWPGWVLALVFGLTWGGIIYVMGTRP